MLKMIHKYSIQLGAAMMVGAMGTPAYAGGGGGGGQDFDTIAKNINSSVEEIPGLISGLSYLFGTLLGVLGILKIKEHVENPQQTELKHGAIRLAAGGGLFALPIVYEAMTTTIGQGNAPNPADLNRAEFSVN